MSATHPDTFQLTGRYRVLLAPQTTDNSGDFEIGAGLLEQFAVKRKVALSVELTADALETIDMTDLAAAHAIVIKPLSPIMVELTSHEPLAIVPTVARLPVGGLFVLVTTDPITGVQLQRLPGIPTSVRLLLVEKA